MFEKFFIKVCVIIVIVLVYICVFIVFLIGVVFYDVIGWRNIVRIESREKNLLY